MEVELALELVDVEEDEYEELKRMGFGEYAYRKVNLPIIFPGLSLFLDYITPEGEESQLSVVVTGIVIYSLKKEILQAVVESQDPIPIDTLTVINGWSVEDGL